MWGEHGQTLLENAQIRLINATALGTDILKKIVGLTIVDSGLVTEEDIGCNFFLNSSSLSQSPAFSCMQLLQELDPNVNGEYMDEAVDQLMDG